MVYPLVFCLESVRALSLRLNEPEKLDVEAWYSGCPATRWADMNETGTKVRTKTCGDVLQKIVCSMQLYK